MKLEITDLLEQLKIFFDKDSEAYNKACNKLCTICNINKAKFFIWEHTGHSVRYKALSCSESCNNKV